MTVATSAGDGLLDGGLVGVLPARVADRLAAACRATGLRQVPAGSFKERSSNAWFRGEVRGEEVFVKLYARPERAAAERLVASSLAPGVAPRLLAGGRADGLGEYAVFRWQSLTPLPATPESAAEAGRLLAAVHDTDLPGPGADGPTPRPPGGGQGTTALSAPEVGEEAFGKLIAALARQAPGLFAEVRGRLTGPKATALVRDAGWTAGRHPPVLLHGDFSLRNTARNQAGHPVVFDFERAEYGPAEHDLRRIWDRELAAIPAGHDTFTTAYRNARAHDPGPPDRIQLDYARLACAVTTLTAARRTHDTRFEAEGRKILEAVT
ncbi:phosphotransferase [Streptomyces sp. NPDC021212]|uniref:phosphotransferase n=1 Tax=Streptomyces sp. NPDC021212 TaxID=3365118 RepID=UPI00379EE879